MAKEICVDGTFRLCMKLQEQWHLRGAGSWFWLMVSQHTRPWGQIGTLGENFREGKDSWANPRWQMALYFRELGTGKLQSNKVILITSDILLQSDF